MSAPMHPPLSFKHALLAMLGRALPITVWSSAESISTSEMPSMASKACLKLNGGCTGAVMFGPQFKAATAVAMREQPCSRVSSAVAIDMRKNGASPYAVPATTATPWLSSRYMTTS